MSSEPAASDGQGARMHIMPFQYVMNGTNRAKSKAATAAFCQLGARNSFQFIFLPLFALLWRKEMRERAG